MAKCGHVKEVDSVEVCHPTMSFANFYVAAALHKEATMRIVIMLTVAILLSRGIYFGVG